jgi:quercetin dioxygenase-like cupin family protein
MKAVLTGSLLLCCILISAALVAQDQAIATKPAEGKMINIPGLPPCIKGQPMRGDPTKGAFVIYGKATAGCDIPTHWHTSTEDVTWLSGSAQLKMKGSADQTLSSGTFVHLPSKHEHAVRCSTACAMYINSDGAFDIHYVDASGKEIPVEQALGGAKKSAATKK